jgi:hypothetical protein
VVCDTGYHLCDGECKSNTSLGSCGPTRCTPCETPTYTGTIATCDGTQCGVACDVDYCGDGTADCDECDSAGGEVCLNNTCQVPDAGQ